MVILIEVYFPTVKESFVLIGIDSILLFTLVYLIFSNYLLFNNGEINLFLILFIYYFCSITKAVGDTVTWQAMVAVAKRGIDFDLIDLTSYETRKFSVSVTSATTTVGKQNDILLNGTITHI